MKPLAKLLYLTRDSKGLKLRRRVPDELRSSVGKSAWVERLGSMPMSTVKERAAMFAVRTDAALRAARTQLSKSRHSSHGADNAPGFIIRPTGHDVEQIALAYFLDGDRALRANGNYQVIDAQDENYADDLEDAGVALRMAELTVVGKSVDPDEDRSSHFLGPALKLLARYGFVADFDDDKRKPIEIDPSIKGSDEFNRLVALLGRADIELARRVYESRVSRHEPGIADQFFLEMVRPGATPAPRHVKSVRTVRQLVNGFAEAKSAEVGRSRLAQFNIPVRSLLEELGADFDVRNISREHIQEIANLLIRVPSHATQHYRDLSLRDAAEAHKKKHQQYPERYDEAAKGVGILKQIFNWAIDQDWLEHSPVDKIKILRPRSAKKSAQANKGYQPFTVAELTKIFSAPLFTGSIDDEYNFATPGPLIHKRSRYWAPIIALWTGMRANEILQLERKDIRFENGVHFFDVNDDEEIEYDPSVFQKRLKNKNSVRDVPMRDELIRLGFLDWVSDRPPGRLFPEASAAQPDRPSIEFSKRFRTFLKSRDVWTTRSKVFHSFRNNFTDALRDGRVIDEYREVILGWAEPKKMDRRYGRGHKLELLKQEVDKAVYDGLTLSLFR